MKLEGGCYRGGLRYVAEGEPMMGGRVLISCNLQFLRNLRIIGAVLENTLYAFDVRHRLCAKLRANSA
jgi:hypothetical protein